MRRQAMWLEGEGKASEYDRLMLGAMADLLPSYDAPKVASRDVSAGRWAASGIRAPLIMGPH